MAHRVDFSEEDKRNIKRLHSQGMGYRKIAEKYNVCKDTISNVVKGTWRPKPAKLPVDDSRLYFEYLMLGSYSAVARQYDANHGRVRRRIIEYRIREGV